MTNGNRNRGRPRRTPADGAAGEPVLPDPFVVQAFWKGLKGLGLFDGHHPEWTVVDLARETGIPRATTYRLVRTLEAAGYLTLDPLTGRYHVGPSAVALTYLSSSYSELVRMTRPYIESLAGITGETVNLAVEIDGKAVLVDEIRTSRPFTSQIPVGRIIGDIGNANGKVFAAFKAPEERERIASLPQEALTPHTLVDRQELLGELEEVRRSGIAYDLEERSLGVCAVSAPVRNQAGMVVAAISVVVPKGRFGPDEKERWARAVREAAGALSAFLGYSAPEEARTRD